MYLDLDTPQPQYVTVRMGETLQGIAERHGIGEETLKILNGLPSDDVVTGQKLIVPPLGKEVVICGSRVELELAAKELGVTVAVVTLLGWLYSIVTEYGWLVAFAAW
jgi:LysM repeat protein